MSNTYNSHSRDPVRVGVFDRKESADEAVARLSAAGFEKERITLVSSAKPRDPDETHNDRRPSGNSAPKAALIGGLIGGLTGAVVCGVSAVTTGDASGLLVAGLSVLGGIGGGVVGAFIGAMLSRGVETEATDYYDQAMQSGTFLVSVETLEPLREERLADAERIFREAGAEPLPLGKQ